MICKDTSLLFSDTFVRINVFQDSKNGFFKDMAPQDLVNGVSSKKVTDSAQSTFLAALKTMLRFNVHLEAGIKIKETGSGKVF